MRYQWTVEDEMAFLTKVITDRTALPSRVTNGGMLRADAEMLLDRLRSIHALGVPDGPKK